MLIAVHKTKWAEGRGGADGGEENKRAQAQSPVTLSSIPFFGHWKLPAFSGTEEYSAVSDDGHYKVRLIKTHQTLHKPSQKTQNLTQVRTHRTKEITLEDICLGNRAGETKRLYLNIYEINSP